MLINWFNPVIDRGIFNYLFEPVQINSNFNLNKTFLKLVQTSSILDQIKTFYLDYLFNYDKSTKVLKLVQSDVKLTKQLNNSFTLILLICILCIFINALITLINVCNGFRCIKHKKINLQSCSANVKVC